MPARVSTDEYTARSREAAAPFRCAVQVALPCWCENKDQMQIFLIMLYGLDLICKIVRAAHHIFLPIICSSLALDSIRQGAWGRNPAFARPGMQEYAEVCKRIQHARCLQALSKELLSFCPVVLICFDRSTCYTSVCHEVCHEVTMSILCLLGMGSQLETGLQAACSLQLGQIRE